MNDTSDSDNSVAVRRFVQYLQVKTVQPSPDYAAAVIFLSQYAEELGLQCQVIYVLPDRPVVLLTWPSSTQPSGDGSIILNSHIDVVPVDEEKWSVPPFEARIVDGKILARGSQDMKIVGIQYMEAIRRLKKSGFSPKRTVYLTFVPDEEIGGATGMALFVQRPEFLALGKIVFALDEGCPSLTNEVPVFWAERGPWWICASCRGTPGHGSLLKSDNAGEKMWRFVNHLMSFRDGQMKRFQCSKTQTPWDLGEMISVNLTMVSGGKQQNVIPSELVANFDVRLPPTADLNAFEKLLESWRHDAAVASGGAPDSISLSFPQKVVDQAVCDVNSTAVRPFWEAFSGAVVKSNMKPKLAIFPAATDCRYFRELGIPALGFSPLHHTPFLLHDHDEYVGVDVFLDGIRCYENILKAIISV